MSALVQSLDEKIAELLEFRPDAPRDSLIEKYWEAADLYLRDLLSQVESLSQAHDLLRQLIELRLEMAGKEPLKGALLKENQPEGFRWIPPVIPLKDRDQEDRLEIGGSKVEGGLESILQALVVDLEDRVFALIDTFQDIPRRDLHQKFRDLLRSYLSSLLAGVGNLEWACRLLGEGLENLLEAFCHPLVDEAIDRTARTSSDPSTAVVH